MELKLGGETFLCHDTVVQGAMLDLAEAMENPRGLKMVLGIGRFLRTAVVDEDRPRLEELLNRRGETGTAVLTFSDLNVAAGELILAYNSVPLDEPSSSGTGSEETGQQLKVVSLSRGTVEYQEQETPQPNRASRRAGRSRVSST